MKAWVVCFPVKSYEEFFNMLCRDIKQCQDFPEIFMRSNIICVRSWYAYFLNFLPHCLPPMKVGSSNYNIWQDFENRFPNACLKINSNLLYFNSPPKKKSNFCKHLFVISSLFPDISANSSGTCFMSLCTDVWILQTTKVSNGAADYFKSCICLPMVCLARDSCSPVANIRCRWQPTEMSYHRKFSGMWAWLISKESSWWSEFVHQVGRVSNREWSELAMGWDGRTPLFRL